MLKKHSVLIETIVHVDIEKLLMVIKALQLGPAKKKKWANLCAKIVYYFSIWYLHFCKLVMYMYSPVQFINDKFNIESCSN